MLHFANRLFLLSRLLCWKYQEDQTLDLIKEEGKGYLFPSTCKRRRYLPCWGSATLKCFQLHVSGCMHGHAHCPFALLFPTNNSLTCGSQQRHSTPWCILWSRRSRDWACGACWRLCTCSSISASVRLWDCLQRELSRNSGKTLYRKVSPWWKEVYKALVTIFHLFQINLFSSYPLKDECLVTLWIIKARVQVWIF